MLIFFYLDFIAADTGYITNGQTAVYTFDTLAPTNPTNPLVTLPMAEAVGIAFLGNIGYISTSKGLAVYTFDLLAPANPTNPLITIPVEAANVITFLGNTGYVTNSDTAVYTFDALNPADPTTPFLTIPSGGNTSGIAFLGNTGYVTNSDTAVYTFDALNPADPINPFVTIPMGENAVGIAFLGNTGYIANGRTAVYTFNALNPADPINPFVTIPMGNTSLIAFLGNTGYVTNGGGVNGTAVYTFDALNPVTPITPFITVPIGYAVGIAFLTQLLPIADLTGNNLIFANYLNTYAPNSTLSLFTSTLESLSSALESADPARNADSIFAAENNLYLTSQSVTQHLRDKHFRNSHTSANRPVTAQAISSQPLLALRSSILERSCCEKEKLSSWWAEGLGAFSHEKAQNQSSAFDVNTVGFITGLDGTFDRDLLGGAIAYTHTYLHQKKNTGHASINQEYGVVYGTVSARDFYADAALWIGLYQIHNVRHIFTGTTAKSDPKGWQVAPHFELGYNCDWRCFRIEPFTILDWVNSWQNRYREQGAAPLNMQQSNQYASMLRSEIGLRFYETISFCWGQFIVQEKASYVNKKPFHIGIVTAFLVGSSGSFTVETLTETQNLGLGEIELLFDPANSSYPYGSISYQVEFSEPYQSHQLFFTLGLNF